MDIRGGLSGLDLLGVSIESVETERTAEGIAIDIYASVEDWGARAADAIGRVLSGLNEGVEA